MKMIVKWMITVLAMAVLQAGCLPAASGGTQITVKEAWGRPSPAEAMMGAFYMVIQNEGKTADTLVGASTPACGTVELHESYMSRDNVMGMRPVEGGKIEVPAGGLVELKPGSLHMMCIQKQVAFEVGEKIMLALQFEQAGELEVEVEIREP